jgi:predicted 3-demethylubiquinone-9 3-methyltransferase (glyoxalase superfamily)
MNARRTREFELAGHRFMALNGGPTFKFTEAISLMVECETQKELDASVDAAWKSRAAAIAAGSKSPAVGTAVTQITAT